MTNDAMTFSPDYAVSPGQTLLDAMEALGLSQADLAERTQRPKKTINEIVKGKAAITPETAIQLERVLGIDAAFWIALEQQYRTYLARNEEGEKLASQIDFASMFPVDELVRRNWIPKSYSHVDTLKRVLEFFGVASPEAWQSVWRDTRASTAFRRSEACETDFGSLAAWLRQGEIQARKLSCNIFNATEFKRVLEKARTMTTLPPTQFIEPLISECASAGVALVVLKEFPKMRTSGAARWLGPNKAFIQLSLLYKRADQFWFSLFHEAGHILLHGKREIFIDDNNTYLEREEEEANRFSRDLLIPPESYKGFVANKDYSEGAIQIFSKAIGIDPGIVVGRLQHDRIIKFSERNKLRTYYHWSD